MFAVGVDVSNGRSMVAVLGARRSVVVQPHEVPQTADGFAELAARLHALDGEVRIVMEHTGRYYESFEYVPGRLFRLRGKSPGHQGLSRGNQRPEGED